MVKIFGANLRLSFYLNAFMYHQFNEGDIGAIKFKRCRQYRMGPPNEEGFFSYNQSRYKVYGVKWGEFYRVVESDWKSSFPQPIYINSKLDNNKLNHYLFYFRDETFECIAEDYVFKVIKDSAILKE